MCGIAGILGRISVDAADQAIAAMISAQHHRGPDDHGFVAHAVGSATLALGNCRLAIQDLSVLGHQPMENPDTGDLLVYNGEIYNAPELRRQLTKEGFRFRGHSDTEVLLRAYQHWGADCLTRFQGMFAFALFDNARKKLFAARDHLGIKPFYFTRHNGVFVFASEIRALLTSRLVDDDIDRRALSGFLAFGSVQEPLTILRNTFALPPASWMEVDLDGNTTPHRQYWSIPAPATGTANMNDLAAEGRAIFDASVKRHLLSDVPVCVFLSSGLDSTAVLGVANKVSDSRAIAFTVSFPDEPRFDEAAIAHANAKRFGVEYRECPVDSSTALRWMSDALRTLDQPTMDGVNTYMVSRVVREGGFSVALSGQGGDELFGGYDSFHRLPGLLSVFRKASFLPPSLRRSAALLAGLPMSASSRDKLRDVAGSMVDIAPFYFQIRRLVSNECLSQLGLAASEVGLTADYQVPELRTSDFVFPSDVPASVSRLESAFYLRNTLLRDGDVFGMANSLEIRVPFLDREFVEWAFRLPGKFLAADNGARKPMLRAMIGDLYSREQLAQPKRGFTPPFGRWLSGPLRTFMNDHLNTLKSTGLVHPRGVDAIRDMFLAQPDSPMWSRVWGLISLSSWYQQHRNRVEPVEAHA